MMHRTETKGNTAVGENFSNTYVNYFPRLVRFAHTYVLSRYEAEHIVQDMFLHLLENPELFESMKNADTWLFTLVKNRCIDFLRSRMRPSGKRHSLDETLNREYELNLYSLQQFDEGSLHGKDLETLFNEAVATLPKRCREVFTLSRFEGLQHKEIAERLGISTNTVERQMNIAIKKLCAELKDYLPLVIWILSNVGK